MSCLRTANNAQPGARCSRVLLVEDHPFIQEAVAKIVGARHELVGIVSRGNAVLAAVQTLQPDAVILDIGLPDMSGMQVVPGLRIEFPGVAIVVLTTKVEPIYREEALARGANEFVSKQRATADLLPAIERALAAVHAATPKRAQGTES